MLGVGVSAWVAPDGVAARVPMGPGLQRGWSGEVQVYLIFRFIFKTRCFFSWDWLAGESRGITVSWALQRTR